MRTQSGSTRKNIDAIVGSGMVAALVSRYDDAEKSFMRALELEPKSASTIFCLAITYASMGRNEESIKTFKEGLAIPPEDEFMHRELGRVYLQIGNKTAAMEEYVMIKRLSPNLAESFLKEIEK